MNLRNIVPEKKFKEKEGNCARHVEHRTMIPKLYTYNEVCQILKITSKSLYLWEKQGAIIPLRTIGNQKRYTEDMIKQIIGLPKE